MTNVARFNFFIDNAANLFGRICRNNSSFFVKDPDFFDAFLLSYVFNRFLNKITPRGQHIMRNALLDGLAELYGILLCSFYEAFSLEVYVYESKNSYGQDENCRNNDN